MKHLVESTVDYENQQVFVDCVIIQSRADTPDFNRNVTLRMVLVLFLAEPFFRSWLKEGVDVQVDQS
ncbi:hypothetical protein D3C76_1335010 [compost metagenome]